MVQVPECINGEWIYQKPVCKPTECPQGVNISNSDAVTESRNIDEVFPFKCFNYINGLTGAQRCGEDGKWIEEQACPAVVYQGKYVEVSEYLTVVSTNCSEACLNDTQCSASLSIAVMCPQGVNIINSDAVTESGIFGDNFTFNCPEINQLTENNYTGTLLCGEDGKWIVQQACPDLVNDTTMYVRALCQASMKKMNYQVFICFSKENEEQHSIDYAYCQCPIGAAQACSHIGALLFALKDLCPQSVTGASCTSTLCTWNVPRGEAKPLPVSAFNRGNEDSNFDPRHSLDRQNDMEKTLTALQGLKEIFPRTGK
ncbi:hypothetical protein LOTGIDRAFT_175794 [Lottia gigantea]|uniref:SWIM-type domain-containing protein n=1 Tax=Lottia gigantea TaxID=225164 RepID=V4ACA1_LOTGI|nr:hypothetical protein LOTGIDRAFT_175794 [Lottia gigantea]ESO90916.1 hypothetical protein LOTGIDRAFT_175794 [Lottia gigantea]